MKFKVDACLPSEFTKILSGAGYEAVTAGMQGLSAAEDSLIARVCTEEGRILLTTDLDFADVRVYPPREFPGLVVFRLRRQGRRRLIQACRKLIPMLKSTSLERRLLIVEEHRVRIREDEGR
jgi:predicted nuclease of predicted toxin-antitoxin system